MMQQEAIGRVLRMSVEGGEAEVGSSVAKGELVAFLDGRGREVVCKVESTTTAGTFDGTKAKLHPLSRIAGSPSPMTKLYRYESTQVTGTFITLGQTEMGQPVKVRVNSLFKHSLVLGKTLTGKTHLGIGVAEELAALGVPNLIVDTQGEFTGLSKSRKNVVVRDTASAQVLDDLRKRRTVVLDLLSLRDKEKVGTFTAVLQHIIDQKETDYAGMSGKRAASVNMMPPIIVTIDEAEVYAPEGAQFKEQVASRAVMVDLAKRRAKFGVGAFIITQRFYNFSTDVRSQCRNLAAFNLSDSGDVTVATNFTGSRREAEQVGTLKEGECLLAGSWVEVPMVVRTKDIQTARTKQLDFEKLLALGQESYALRRKIRGVNQDEDERRLVCSSCRAECKKRPTAAHGVITFAHDHYVCPTCKDQWCPLLEKWMNSEAKLDSTVSRHSTDALKGS